MEEYLVSIGIKKAVIAAVGFLASQEAVTILTKYGIHIDSATLQVALTSLCVGGFHWFHDLLKAKYGVDWL